MSTVTPTIALFGIADAKNKPAFVKGGPLPFFWSQPRQYTNPQPQTSRRGVGLPRPGQCCIKDV